MGPLPTRARGRLGRGSDGFTLVELLTSMFVLIIVFSAIVSLVPVGFRHATRSQERTFTVLEARTAVERALRELRTATSIVPSAQVIRYDTPTRSVTIECTAGGGMGGAGQGQSSGACNRREAPLGQNPSNNPATKIASGVTNTDVFSVAPGTPSGRDYVCVKLVLAVPGSSAPVTIQSATALRNNSNPLTDTPPCSG